VHASIKLPELAHQRWSATLRELAMENNNGIALEELVVDLTQFGNGTYVHGLLDMAALVLRLGARIDDQDETEAEIVRIRKECAEELRRNVRKWIPVEEMSGHIECL
jgi:hypothetical protein